MNASILANIYTMITFPPIRINLTNICNQACPFCFASTEMKTNTIKYLSLKDLRTVINLSGKAGIRTAQLLGGEPTLHPKLPQVLRELLRSFYSVRVFTNGIFPAGVESAIKLYGKRIGLTVNIATPGFVFNPKIRHQVLENTKRLCKTNPVALSLVSTFLTPDYQRIIDLIDFKLLNRVDILLSLSLPEAHTINTYTLEQFPQIGDGIASCVHYLRERGYQGEVSLTNSGLRPCMFRKPTTKYLREQGFETDKTTCHTDEDLFTVSFDQELSSYKCYPLSTDKHLTINQKSDFRNLQKRYAKLIRKSEHQLVLPGCKTCPFFGFAKNQCSGPCLGFRINALKQI